VHSAFTFAHESLVARSVVSDAEVPPGTLISFLQKGLQFVEIETHLQEDGSERACDEPFTMLAPHVCKLKSSVGRVSSGEGGAGGGIGGGAAAAAAEVGPGDVAVLPGHAGEVFALAWNSRTGALATGSGDGSARVWRVPGIEGSSGSTSGDVCTVLRHAGGAEGSRVRKDDAHDICALEWSPDGTRLLTGSVDGRARVWSGATLQHTLTQHVGQIYACQWNPSGSLIATASGACVCVMCVCVA
jgi:transducin (beta)-like 1